MVQLWISEKLDHFLCASRAAQESFFRPGFRSQEMTPINNLKIEMIIKFFKNIQELFQKHGIAVLVYYTRGDLTSAAFGIWLGQADC